MIRMEFLHVAKHAKASFITPIFFSSDQISMNGTGVGIFAFISLELYNFLDGRCVKECSRDKVERDFYDKSLHPARQGRSSSCQLSDVRFYNFSVPSLLSISQFARNESSHSFICVI